MNEILLTAAVWLTLATWWFDRFHGLRLALLIRAAWVGFTVAGTLASVAGQTRFQFNEGYTAALLGAALIAWRAPAWLRALLIAVSISLAHVPTALGISFVLATDWLQSLAFRWSQWARTVIYLACFGCLFLWAAPNALAAMSDAPPVKLLSLWALALGALGILWCAAHLTRGGGTPDPLDPPLALAYSGPYRYLKHPMQWIQGLLVLAATLGHESWQVQAYGIFFCAALWGPFRWYEVSRLRRRFYGAGSNTLSMT
jgi:Phospholipid methyltransferase